MFTLTRYVIGLLLNEHLFVTIYLECETFPVICIGTVRCYISKYFSGLFTGRKTCSNIHLSKNSFAGDSRMFHTIIPHSIFDSREVGIDGFLKAIANKPFQNIHLTVVNLTYYSSKAKRLFCPLTTSFRPRGICYEQVSSGRGSKALRSPSSLWRM